MPVPIPAQRKQDEALSRNLPFSSEGLSRNVSSYEEPEYEIEPLEVTAIHPNCCKL